MRRLRLSLIAALLLIGIPSIALAWMWRMSRQSLEVIADSSFEPAGSMDYRRPSVTWSNWRGTDFTNVDRVAAPPADWSLPADTEWTFPLEGRARSMPVIGDGLVFLTNSYADEARLTLIALDEVTGELVWESDVHKGVKLPVLHEKNSHASATPAVVGDSVITVFALEDEIWVSSVSHEGNVNWQTNAGPFHSHWGYGSSPAVYGRLVIVAGESRGAKLGRIFARSFLCALDSSTGDLIWRIPRPEDYNYGAPVVPFIAGRSQLLQAGLGSVTSFDPETGNEIWTVASVISRSANAVAFDEDVVYSTSTYPTGELLAIDASGHGDVTATSVRWTTTRGCSDVPSPLVYNDLLFVLADNGVLTVYDKATGEVRTKKRLPGDFSASPCVAGGQLYVVSEQGVLHVLTADHEVETTLKVTLPAPVFTNPIFKEDFILVRTDDSLIKIRKSDREE